MTQGVIAGIVGFILGLWVAVNLNHAGLGQQLGRGFIDHNGQLYRVEPAEIAR